MFDNGDYNAYDAYDIFLNDRHIDTVYYIGNNSENYVKQSLIEHDGYASNIRVYKVVKLQKKKG